MRTYKRKLTLDKDRRMAVAVRLTAEGLSLREVAARLSVSHQTVSNDLARWAERTAGSHTPTRDKIIAQTHITRAQQAGVPWEWVSLTVVAERDQWLCGICREPVLKRWEDANRELMPSLDHIVPIWHGGPHLYGNVQLAHFFCNLSKGGGKREPHRTQSLTLASFSEAARRVFEREAAA